VASALKTGLPPIAGTDTRLFILGSLPGDASLAAARYYAHPRNQFWRLVGAAIGEPLADCAYADRLERLRAHGVGLWDVVAAAERRGSTDGALRKVAGNPLQRLIADYPMLRAIAFNGATAAARGRRLLGEAPGLDLIDLPSSSPANTRPFAEKLRAWSVLADYCTSHPA
jgi:double-stranded uracil-DNA glycosylase